MMLTLPIAVVGRTQCLVKSVSQRNWQQKSRKEASQKNRSLHSPAHLAGACPWPILLPPHWSLVFLLNKSELFPSQGLCPCCFFLSSVPPLHCHVLQEAIGLSGYAGFLKILLPSIDLQCSPTKGGLFPGLPLAHHHVIVLHILFWITHCYILSLHEIICWLAHCLPLLFLLKKAPCVLLSATLSICYTVNINQEWDLYCGYMLNISFEWMSWFR